MINLKKLKKVILMLQKFEDVLKTKVEQYTKMKQMEFLHMNLIRQLIKNKKKKIMTFKINIKENDLNKQKKQKKLRKALQNK